MYKIHFHKTLLKDNRESTISVDINKVSQLISYIHNFYPEIPTDRVLLLNQEKIKFPDSWIMKDEIPESQKICYIVPLISGNIEAMAAALPSILFKAVAGTVISFALSAVISAIMPKPKNNSGAGITDQDRINNDSFEGLINTVDSSNSIPLNYGMVRVAGQIISADVNTVNHSKEDVISVSSYV